MMRNRTIGTWVAALCAVWAVITAAADLAPSDRPATPADWQQVAKWPDLTGGMWGGQFGPNGRPVSPPPPSLTPPAAAALQARRASDARQQGSASCAPVGPVGMRDANYSLKFFYTRGEILIMTDLDNLWVRRVHMDLSSHGDPDPSYHGHSIGHWEGNTLVVDTIALLPDVNIVRGVPASDRSHLVERYQLVSPDELDYTGTATDPNSLTAPYTVTKKYFRHRDWTLQDAWCGQSNRDAPDAQGNYKVDLTPPEGVKP